MNMEMYPLKEFQRSIKYEQDRATVAFEIQKIAHDEHGIRSFKTDNADIVTLL